jgi:hypothetical protein
MTGTNSHRVNTYNGSGVNHVKRLRPKRKKEKISLSQLRRSYMTPLIGVSVVPIKIQY